MRQLGSISARGAYVWPAASQARLMEPKERCDGVDSAITTSKYNLWRMSGDIRLVNRLSSRLCRKKSKEKIEPDFNRSFSPFLSPPWPRSIAHKRLASMDSGYNQRHDFLSFNHFPEPVGEGEMEEEIVCNRWRDLAGEQIFGQLVRPKDCSPSRLSEEMSVVWASHSAQGHFFPSNDQPPTTFSFFLLAVRSLLARYTIVFLFSRDRRDGK